MINRNSFSRRWCHLAAEKELKQHGVHSVTDLLTDQRVCVCCVGGLCVLTFSPSGVWVIPHRCVLFEALWRISSSVSNPHPNTIETSSCMRNRGLKRPAPSEILLSGTVSEEEEWPIPECHVTHWKVLKCPTTSKSGWQNLSWNYQKVNIKTTLYIFYPNYRARVSSSQVHPVGPNHSVRSQGNVWCIKFHSCFGSREPFGGILSVCSGAQRGWLTATPFAWWFELVSTFLIIIPVREKKRHSDRSPTHITEW